MEYRLPLRKPPGELSSAGLFVTMDALSRATTTWLCVGARIRRHADLGFTVRPRLSSSSPKAPAELPLKYWFRIAWQASSNPDPRLARFSHKTIRGFFDHKALSGSETPGRSDRAATFSSRFDPPGSRLPRLLAFGGRTYGQPYQVRGTMGVRGGSVRAYPFRFIPAPARSNGAMPTKTRRGVLLLF